MRKIGYARVSTPQQNLDRQIAALRTEGCSAIFREKASGKDLVKRPQLERAIDKLGVGDVLVLAEWDRCTRSLMDGVKIMVRLQRRGATIKVLDKPGLDLTTPTGQGILALLSGLAQEERERIVRRAKDGRTLARARGVRFGPKPKLSAHQRREALQHLQAGESTRALGRSYDVSHGTISRVPPK
jgi:DNA invertase Pin-like site-specific DNA recombinase